MGVDSLAASISEERGTIEDVLEPYLIQQGYMIRTPRGRMVTRNAYLHFGLPPTRGRGGNLPLDLDEDGEPGDGMGNFLWGCESTLRTRMPGDCLLRQLPQIHGARAH